MGILDVFKKKEEQAVNPQEGLPISQAIQMKERGLTNNQIIQVLQQQGYGPQQIYDALAQAEARQSIAAPPGEMPPPGMPAQEPMQEPVQDTFQEPAPTASPYEQSTEGMVEQVIDEKWKKVTKEIGKISELKEHLNSRMERIEQQIADIKSDVDGLHKAIIARVGQYDKTLSEVGTEIKAMEKVFKEVLPEMTGNIQELSKITKEMKGKKTEKKESEETADKLESLAKRK